MDMLDMLAVVQAIVISSMEVRVLESGLKKKSSGVL